MFGRDNRSSNYRNFKQLYNEFMNTLLASLERRMKGTVVAGKTYTLLCVYPIVTEKCVLRIECF